MDGVLRSENTDMHRRETTTASQGEASEETHPADNLFSDF